jgi:hypothetical protein
MRCRIEILGDGGSESRSDCERGGLYVWMMRATWNVVEMHEKY